MKAMNGIELCRAVRKLDENVYFCMITNYVEYAPSGYEAGVFRYLLKPVVKEDVLKVLDDLQSIASSSQKIIIKSFHESVIIKSESLIYIEVKDKYSFVHYWTEETPRREETIITASSLHHLEETLTGKNFCRIHRKYFNICIKCNGITDHIILLSLIFCQRIYLSYQKITIHYSYFSCHSCFCFHNRCRSSCHNHCFGHTSGC